MHLRPAWRGGQTPRFPSVANSVCVRVENTIADLRVYRGDTDARVIRQECNPPWRTSPWVIGQCVAVSERRETLPRPLFPISS